jgi:1-acyl-sn-glycerol-3-phosphate acyltransferase
VSARPPVTLPPQWPWLVRGFTKYCVRYARRHFHGVRLAKASAPLPSTAPLLIALNHPGWWDPILCVLLSRRLPAHTHYGAIDAIAVRKYPMLTRAGLFPVDRSSFAGVAQFMREGEAILSQPQSALWITAQGEFADVRQRPLNLQRGVGHLAARMTAGHIVPIAMEYAFWNESKPEALIQIGEAIPIDPGVRAEPSKSDTPPNGKSFTSVIETALTQTLDSLNAAVMTRDAALFTPLIEGKSGVGGLYDLWRRLQANVTGRRFDASHGGAVP